ncbi:hypothetical protein HPB47_027861 [Ixodes persulcatus]|uniref:Uncharacterized protein n=1 Tax=Ixodes persulcatus TaxID=34615 RepID=A0AC60PUU5_IXOPE|nr:hypothetical protein HPB47_027861 [Ixodes persulcatus]
MGHLAASAADHSKSDSDDYVDSENPEWAQPDERGRKRRRRSGKWKRNVSKTKRNQGDEYTNTAGRVGVSLAKAKDVRKLLRYVSAGKRSALEEYLQQINGVADNENSFDVDDKTGNKDSGKV